MESESSIANPQVAIDALGIDPEEIVSLLEALASDAKNPSDNPAARRLAELLSDEFADQNDVAGRLVRKVIELSKQAWLKQSGGKKKVERFQDIIDVALARIDKKAGIKYWLRKRDGSPIQFTALNGFEIDFFDYAYQEHLIAAIHAAMGSGKTSIILGLIAFEIGRDQNTSIQLICASQPAANVRVGDVMRLLESPHYKKVNPHVKKNPAVWGTEKLLVQRTKATKGDITRESRGDASAKDATLAGYGAESRQVLGTRSLGTYLDDIVTELAVRNPNEGKALEDALRRTIFTREEQPIGQTQAAYDGSGPPIRIIGTPWSDQDPIYKMRDWHGATTVVVGVNETFTAYNVQLWNLPKKYCELLKKKYGTGTVQFPPMKEMYQKMAAEWGIPVVTEYTLGDGMAKDKLVPPGYTMEIPLAVAREWYIERYAAAKDKRKDFDQPYRCEVFTEGELAFPNFRNALHACYPAADGSWPLGRDGKETGQPMVIDKSPIYTMRQGQREVTGWLAYLVAPPVEPRKIALVDLSKPNRWGTVISVGQFTSMNHCRVIEIARGGWTGPEIEEQLDQLFSRHEDLDLCYIESVALQTLTVDLLASATKEKRWAYRVVHFGDTATLKDDPDVGILTLAQGFESGFFELPDVMSLPGHGRTCECGYCVGAVAAMTQSRLAKVSSDVLVTWWGLMRRMQRTTLGQQDSVPATTQRRAQSGYELMQPRPGPAIAATILGTGSQRPAGSSEKPEGAIDTQTETLTPVDRQQIADEWR